MNKYKKKVEKVNIWRNKKKHDEMADEEKQERLQKKEEKKKWMNGQKMGKKEDNHVNGGNTR